MEIPYKIEKHNSPVKKGELYLVPCIVHERLGLLYITPIINHPHSDKENEQSEIHYHADYRFIKHKDDYLAPTIINKHSKHIWGHNLRPVDGVNGNLCWYVLPVINEGFSGITNPYFIKNSKLKHKCIRNGKCAHRGYDLAQVKPKSGVIKCPLHGLEFNEKNGELLTKIS